MNLAIIQQASMELGARGGVWPDTVTGWITVIGFLVTLIGGIIAWGKALERINGLGGRVSDVEREQGAARGRETEMVRMVDRVTQAQSQLMERIGEAKQAAAACDERTRDVAIDIGAKIDELIKDINESRVDTAREIGGIQATLKGMHRGQP